MEKRAMNRLRRLMSLAGLMIILVWGNACLKMPKPGLEGTPGFHDLIIRARKQVDGKMKGGRVMLKIQEKRGLVLFLTPLNQVALKLEVSSGGQAALFNPKKRNFWTGAVTQMMKEIWNLPLDWPDLVSMLLHGRMPPGRDDIGSWTLLRSTGEGWQEGELNGPYGLWRFTVLRRGYIQNPLPTRQNLDGWTPVSLEELFK